MPSWSSIGDTGDTERNSNITSGILILTGGTPMNQWKPKEAKWEHVT